MNKIEQVFFNNKAFIPFITAGDPNLNATREFILELAKAKADLIEIGIPFSDPVAEGSVIEEASKRALTAGTTTDKIFKMLEEIKTKINTPLIFMTYINPIFVYGKEKFFANCAKVGICGVIVPDLPFEEKDEIYQEAKKYGIEIISLIAPTSKNRIKMIADKATGFIYCVSSLGVTGVRDKVNADINEVVETIRMYTNKPIAIGFGISTPKQAQDMAKIADGVIVGSAIVKIIAEHRENAGDYIFTYVKSMKEAIMKN